MKNKSQGVQFFLTLLFGPLGLFYSAPGTVLIFIIGFLGFVVAAAMLNMPGGLAVILLLAIYVAQFTVGYRAVEKYNHSINEGEINKKEADERRHQELLLATRSILSSQSSDETKACPFCAETILAAAIKCKHCGSTLN